MIEYRYTSKLVKSHQRTPQYLEPSKKQILLMKLGRIKLKDKEEKNGFIGYVIESL